VARGVVVALEPLEGDIDDEVPLASLGLADAPLVLEAPLDVSLGVLLDAPLGELLLDASVGVLDGLLDGLLDAG
jgi:hypothetical protein